MRVLVCKFSNDRDVEHRISQLVSRGKKSTAKVKVFCADEQVQRKLESVGISSAVLHDFYRTGGADDEASWETAYGLLDRLHSSAEHDYTLRYSGINFLGLEWSIVPYVLAVKLANLCTQMAGEGYETLILVLTGPLSTSVPDISLTNVKTVKYGGLVPSLLMTRVWRYAIAQVRPQGRGSFLRAAKSLFATCKQALVRGYFRSKGSSAAAMQPGRGLMGSQKVLFVLSSPLYARPALAIARECRHAGMLPSVATDDLTLGPMLKRQVIEYRINPMLQPWRAAKVLPSLYWLTRKLRRHTDSFYKNASGLDPKSDEFAPACFFRMIQLDRLPFLCFLAISDILFLERVMKAKSPDILCLMPDGAFPQQIASNLAKKYGIPTLACSAAVETGNARAHFRHLQADKIATMGEVGRRIYVESGVSPDRVVVTGIAHFDLLFNRDVEGDSQVLLTHEIDPGRGMILFTTDNISFAETEKMLTGVINAVLKMKDVQLVVKVHPSEPIEVYQTLAAKYEDSRIRVVKDIDLYALISNCALLITKYSTTALEAMMIDKPVVVINLAGQPTPVPYAEEGAALGVYRQEDIEQAILKALYDEETRTRLKAGRDRFVRNWAGEPDGKASQRIVALMKEMIASGKR